MKLEKINMKKKELVKQHIDSFDKFTVKKQFHSHYFYQTNFSRTPSFNLHETPENIRVQCSM